MNTVPIVDGTAAEITSAIDQIANCATNHLSRLSSVRLLKFELWLPEGVRDEENRLFQAFAESFRQFLAYDGLFPFCLWRREQVGNRRRYLCAWFLGDFSSPLVNGYFKVAATIWQKTLGFRKDKGEIRWPQGNPYGQPMANGTKIKEGWSDDLQVTAICNQWLAEMRRCASQVQDPHRVLQTFGAVHQY
jgi:hypothetical protein